MTLEEKIADLNAEMPVPISEFDFDEAILTSHLNRGFVYDRRYGVFRVRWASHGVFMAEFHAWLNGCEDVFDLAEKLGDDVLNEFDYYADEYMRLNNGTAFLSSVGSRINTWNSKSLNRTEKRVFGKRLKISYIED